MPTKDCPRVFTTLNENNDINLIIKDNSRNDIRKGILYITSIHNNLGISENSLRIENAKALGNMNFVVADITFRISTGNHKDDHQRTFITFPIKVPGKIVYSMTHAIEDIQKHLDNINSEQDAKEYIYKLMKERYQKGHNIAGENRCGHIPQFEDVKGDAQYTHHSEQALLNYLATPQAAEMLLNRLSAEIRAQDLSKHGDTVKIYSIILHLHSTKTPCGPCERSVIGVHHSAYRENTQEKKQFLLRLVEETIIRRKADKTFERYPIQFTYPKRCSRDGEDRMFYGIEMTTTYTANTHDADHRKTYQGDLKEELILRSTLKARNHIYVVNNKAELDEDYLNQIDSSLTFRTLFTSASVSNKYSPEALDRTKTCIDEDDQDLKHVRNLFSEKCNISKHIKHSK